MPTFFELFYARLKAVVEKYRHILLEGEEEQLLEVESARSLFAHLPDYVANVHGLSDALEEKDPIVRANRVETVCMNHALLPHFFDVGRLHSLSQEDKEFLGTVLSAFYYLSISATK